MIPNLPPKHPYGCVPILRQIDGGTYDKLVLLSMVGWFNEPGNDVVLIGPPLPASAYRLEWLRGLHAMIVFNNASARHVAEYAAVILNHEPASLHSWWCEKDEGYELYFATEPQWYEDGNGDIHFEVLRESRVSGRKLGKSESWDYRGLGQYSAAEHQRRFEARMTGKQLESNS